jgi:hypothetical protein
MSYVIDNGNANPVGLGDRWTPKLNGAIYCSPACGANCKKAEFDRATERAAALAARLGSGWRPQVWENLGWHFEVKKGAAAVSVDEHGVYHASIRFLYDDRCEQCVEESRTDPREAMGAVVDVINQRIAALKRALLSVSIGPAEIQDV